MKNLFAAIHDYPIGVSVRIEGDDPDTLHVVQGYEWFEHGGNLIFRDGSKLNLNRLDLVVNVIGDGIETLFDVKIPPSTVGKGNVKWLDVFQEFYNSDHQSVKLDYGELKNAMSAAKSIYRYMSRNRIYDVRLQRVGSAIYLSREEAVMPEEDDLLQKHNNDPFLRDMIYAVNNELGRK